MDVHEKSDSAELGSVFAALANPARRAKFDALGRGADSVSDLATPHGMLLSRFRKHVRVLEGAGLIKCVKPDLHLYARVEAVAPINTVGIKEGKIAFLYARMHLAATSATKNR